MAILEFPWLWLLPVVLFIWGVCFLAQKQKGLPPGPFFWPIVGCAFSLQQPLHSHFAKMTERYGPIMYLKIGAGQVIVINNGDIAKEVLKTKDSELANRPPSTTFEILSLGYNDIAFSDYTEHMRTLRKTSNHHLFSQSKLNETFSIRESEQWNMVLEIHATSMEKQDVDLRKILVEYSTNIIWSMLFGSKSACTAKAMDLVKELVVPNNNIGELFPALDWLDLQGAHKKSRQIIADLKGILSETIINHRRQGGIFETLNDISVLALLIDLVVGGLGSTQITLEWAMAELLSISDTMLKKAQEELDNVVGRARLVKETDLPHLPYINAVFKETLRLHPPGPLSVPHYNEKATTLAGYHIPAKCKIITNLWAIGRDPAHWEDPEVFKPERFLGSNISALPGVSSGTSFHYIPFSSGRRTCIGYPLAMRSVPLALATLLQAFDWNTGGRSLEERKDGSMGSELVNKLVARAQPRLVHEAYSRPLVV